MWVSPVCHPCDQILLAEMRGLKDHEIQELVNAVRDEVQPIATAQCLRELISRAVVQYLEGKGLRRDKR